MMAQRHDGRQKNTYAAMYRLQGNEKQKRDAQGDPDSGG